MPRDFGFFVFTHGSPKIEKSWEEARKYCQNLGGDLASITDQSEHQRILDHIAKNGIDEPLWIGANDKKSEGSFEWSDGRRFSFSHWNSGEPNNYGGGEECVLLLPSKDRRWNDNGCHKKFSFVCNLL